MFSGDYQGWVCAYHLTRKRLWLKAFRLLPLAWVRLDAVRTLRRAESGEFWEGGWRRLFFFWRTWHWPYPISMLGSRSSVVFLIETDGGTRVLLRLAPGIHYRLRGAINEARVRRHGENVHSRPVGEWPAGTRS